MDQATRTMRIKSPASSTLILSFSLIMLTACVPTHIKELEWCRNIEATQSLVNEKERDKLAKAMVDNKCEAKFLEAQKAAEKKAKEAAKLSASKQPTKTPPPPAKLKPAPPKAKP